MSTTGRISAFMRYLAPPQEARVPVTLSNLTGVVLLPWLPVMLAAYLSRKRNSHILRLGLVLLSPLLIMRVAFGYVFLEPDFRWLNWINGILGVYCTTRTLEMCFASPGRLRVGETELPEYPRFKDAVGLLTASRGYNWDFGTGTGMMAPPFTKPLERGAYIRATAIRTVLSFICFDMSESLVKLAPCASTPDGGSIFLSHLPPVQRYVLSTGLTLFTGLTVVFGFTFMHELSALIAVSFLGHLPTEWPPLFDAPWLSRSLAEFWARRWHQILRSTFLDLGGYPLAALLSPLGKYPKRIGLVMGSFLASGIMHDLGMWNLDRGIRFHAVILFTAQGVLVLAEYVFRVTTGHRVGGLSGRVWTYTMILVAGQPMIDAWHRQGILAGMILPPEASVAKRVIIPFVQSLLADNAAWKRTP